MTRIRAAALWEIYTFTPWHLNTVRSMQFLYSRVPDLLAVLAKLVICRCLKIVRRSSQTTFG
jgi:hypothetical protein